MSTRAEQIMVLLETKLKAAPDLVDGNVWRSRLRPIPEGTDFAIVLRQGTDLRVDDATIRNVQRQLTVTVEVYARGDVPDELADPVVEDVVERMMEDTGLGGLCDDIVIGNKIPNWDSRETDLVVMDVDFLIDYEVGSGSL